MSQDCEMNRQPALYISIGEAARLVGVNPATLRAWERRGLFAADRSPSGIGASPSATSSICSGCDVCESIPNRGAARRAMARASPEVTDERQRHHRRAGAPWGQRLREQRKHRGLSLRQAAVLTGLSASFISGIERGLANPSVAALQKLTAAYGPASSISMEAGVAPRGRLCGTADRQRYAPADGVTMDQLNFGDHVMELHLFMVEPGAGTGGNVRARGGGVHHDAGGQTSASLSIRSNTTFWDLGMSCILKARIVTSWVYRDPPLPCSWE